MRNRHSGRKISKLGGSLEYWTRQAGRGIFLVLAIAVLFVIVMAFVWMVPKVWHWALS